MSFTAEDESVFVAGCENGTIVKCSLDSAAAVGVLNSTEGMGLMAAHGCVKCVMSLVVILTHC